MSTGAKDKGRNFLDQLGHPRPVGDIRGLPCPRFLDARRPSKEPTKERGSRVRVKEKEKDRQEETL